MAMDIYGDRGVYVIYYEQTASLHLSSFLILLNSRLAVTFI